MAEASRRAFSKAEGNRAARLIAGAGWKDAFCIEDAFLMISDLALHEPGPNGHRAYERFLAGVWIEDLMHEKQRLWLMDRSAEANASEGVTLALRVLDAGRFHVSVFCIPDFPPLVAEMYAHDLLSDAGSLTVVAYRYWMMSSVGLAGMLHRKT